VQPGGRNRHYRASIGPTAAPAKRVWCQVRHVVAAANGVPKKTTVVLQALYVACSCLMHRGSAQTGGRNGGPRSRQNTGKYCALLANGMPT
jgi:hypothetical protein